MVFWSQMKKKALAVRLWEDFCFHGNTSCSVGVFVVRNGLVDATSYVIRQKKIADEQAARKARRKK